MNSPDRDLAEVIEGAILAANGAGPLPIPTGPEEDDLIPLEAELDAQRSGKRKTIPLIWRHLSERARPLRPGSVTVLCGPPGSGKSFFAAHMALAAHQACGSWLYLPLEDRRVDFQWRLLAILARDYKMIDEDEEGVAHRQEHIDQWREHLQDISRHVCENPRMGVKNTRGKTVIPPLPHTQVLDWMARALKRARVIFVDPLSQVEFPGQKSYEAEADFYRKSVALASDTGGTIVIVVHPSKRPGKMSSIPLVIDDMQGSVMANRLIHCGLLLEAHDPKTSAVYRFEGMTTDVEHNRTVTIGKTRNGKGMFERLAFRQSSDAPEFEELGVIAPKQPREPKAIGEVYGQ